MHPCLEGTVLVTLVQTMVCPRGGLSPPPTSSEWFMMYGEHLTPKSISNLLATRSSFFFFLIFPLLKDFILSGKVHLLSSNLFCLLIPDAHNRQAGLAGFPSIPHQGVCIWLLSHESASWGQHTMWPLGLWSQAGNELIWRRMWGWLQDPRRSGLKVGAGLQAAPLPSSVREVSGRPIQSTHQVTLLLGSSDPPCRARVLTSHLSRYPVPCPARVEDG